jgi:hypothetical protein
MTPEFGISHGGAGSEWQQYEGNQGKLFEAHSYISF